MGVEEEYQLVVVVISSIMVDVSFMGLSVIMVLVPPIFIFLSSIIVVDVVVSVTGVPLGALTPGSFSELSGSGAEPGTEINACDLGVYI